MSRIDGLLKKSYDGKDTRCLDFVANLGASLSLTDKEKAILEDRFTYCITNSAVKDNYKDTKAFLKGELKNFNEDFEAIKAAASKWLESFLCDANRQAFMFCPLYLRITEVIASDLELFFRKFTNTRKHGATMYDQEGNRIYHDFCDYSPSLSVEYVPSIFLIKEYGESFEEIYRLYQEVISVIRNIYWYSQTIDQLEKMRKRNADACRESLQKLIDEIVQDPYSPAEPFPSPFQVEQAKSILPRDVLEKIFSLPIPKLYMDLYHELPSKYGKALVVMISVRQQAQMDLDDEGFVQVFAHIKDPQERYGKACQAKYLLAHIEELAKKSVKKNNEETYIDKGKVARAFYEWTKTKVSETSFVNYYNKRLGDGRFGIAQSTLNNAHNHSKISSSDNDVFSSNLADLLKRYEGEKERLMVVPTVPVETHTSNVRTATFSENYCMRSVDS